ncbi:MAG TPA: hypothetical protein VMG10_34180 [Gemmataceae bacterium]|nr:hypothetical protein [Gemmataceae bacterium]
MRCSFFTRFRRLLVLISVLALASVVPALLADDPPAEKAAEKKPRIGPPTAEELAGQRMQFMKTALSRYTVQVGKSKEPAKVGDPCLRWTNPIAGAPDGIVAVYAHEGGRPAALGQLFLNDEKQWCNEFTIIAENDVAIKRSDRLFWKPSEYVCKLTDLPRSPRPSDKPVLRLAQMRSIAGDFSVISYFRGNKHGLRLLRQPVYRYSEKGKILDGALFVFVLGTDPDCGLLLEAYQDKKGSHYRYALAPITVFKLEVRYKDDLVWSVEGTHNRSILSAAYTPEPGEVLPK